MSLINDALRRVTQNPKRDPKEIPPMEPTYRPVRTGGPGFSIFVVCFLIAAALTLGLWVYWRRGLAAPTAKPEPAAAPNTNNNPIARASRTLNAVDAANKEGENAADSFQAPARSATATARTRTAANASPTGAAGAASAGGPKLQGIFFSANNPSAIINGKSMKVGDEADGIKILEINKQSVRVQAGGEVRELMMK
jgi:hypothetical protein